MVQIRLLGGVGATADTGEVIDVGPAKCQMLLAALALAPETAVPVSRLVDLVWGEDPPRTAEKTLQTYIARLRRGLDPDALRRVGAAYQLDVPRASVDAVRFQDLLAAGDTPGALRSWTGLPLAGLEAPGMSGVVDGLVEQWLGAVEGDLERRIDADPASTVATLTELTSAHPFREGLWALLMTALYRTGRQADALAAFRRARGHLVQELGVEPGPRLRELESLVLGQDQRLEQPVTGPAASAAPVGTVTFAFSDIVGSSEMWARHRRGMARAVERHDAVVRGLCTDHGGYVFATGGDSFGVAFASVQRALAWADALHPALAEESWPEGVTIAVRVGVHTGEADERAGDYFGPVVNIAARVADAGHGGQTVLSAVTASLTDRRDLRLLGSFRLDGLPDELTLHQVGDQDHPPLRTDRASLGNLPTRLGRLHGRDADVTAVMSAIEEAPIVTLVGPGGIGKTRLALSAAAVAGLDRRAGVWLVELAEVADDGDVVRAVIDALDVNVRDATDPLAAVIARIEGTDALVVLDNCEHVVDGAADVASAIVHHCPDVKILATSREGLAVPAERIVVVGPLGGDAAVGLFTERAISADPGFDLADAEQEVQEICQRLDGVPLALELAAARLRALGASEIVARLDDRLRLLTGGRRRSVERHRTLRATIQWSHDLLTPGEQVTLRRLSVFAGSFDLAAAEHVLSGDGDLDNTAVHNTAVDVADAIGSLVDQSMLIVESGPFGRRYRLLETIRQFSAEQLTAADEADMLAARHAAFVGDEVARLRLLLLSNDEIEGAARLTELWPNLRAAVEWGFAVEDRHLVAALVEPVAIQAFTRRGLFEIAEWMERLIAITPQDDVEALATALMWASMPYSMTQERQRFRELIDSCGRPDHIFVDYAVLMAVEDDDFGALEVGPKMADEMHGRGETAMGRLFEMFTAASLLTSGDVEEADRRLTDLAVAFRADGPPSFLNWTLFLIGACAAFVRDMERAEACWEEIATIAVPPRTNSPNETLSARAAFRQGRRHEAYATLRRYIDDLDEDDNMAGVAMVGIEFVTMMAQVGRLRAAAEILGHFDATGLMQVEGPGFKVMIEDAADAVAADPEAAAARRGAGERGVAEPEALAIMAGVLDELLAD